MQRLRNGRRHARATALGRRRPKLSYHDATHCDGCSRKTAFPNLQKQVRTEISFLRADAQARIERAAAAAAQVMLNRRRIAHTGRMLLEGLGKQGNSVPDDLRRDLESTESTANPEAAIARGFALLTPVAAKGVPTTRQLDLASRLGRDEKRVTLADWLASQSSFTESDSNLRIDRHLAELSTLDADPSPFAARAAAIAREPPPRQALLADSLLVDLAHAVKEERARSARLADLRERAAELAHHGSAVALALRGRIEAAIAAKDGSSAPALTAEADALAQEDLRALAADARRRAVLQGLASLGYEVSEGMATAWVQGGQVVLRKAANPDYGVELAGGTKSERLQVRAVAFGGAQSPRNVSRDRDMEAVWCSEFKQLGTMLSKSGGGIEIERALPVGATPLKLVEDPKRGEEADDGKTTLTRLHQLRGLGDTKVLKSLGRSPKGRHYRG
jgi:hypothetical protein